MRRGIFESIFSPSIYFLIMYLAPKNYAAIIKGLCRHYHYRCPICVPQNFPGLSKLNTACQSSELLLLDFIWYQIFLLTDNFAYLLNENVLFYPHHFSGVFAKLRKATTRFFTIVCLIVLFAANISVPIGRLFMKLVFEYFFENPLKSCRL